MSLTKQDLQDLFLAGKIAKLTLEKIEPYIKAGTSIGTLYDSIVKLITSTKGADLAFPPNISINECAAHDSAAPHPSEKRVIPKNALIKIDIGANLNGMLSDTAKTFSVGGKNTLLIKAAKTALQNAIDIVKPGIRVSEIGVVVQETIEEYGFKPVSNLTGHLIEKGKLHAGLSVPNVKSPTFSAREKLKIGMILAIEPFSTNGSAGYIVSSENKPLIYAANKEPKTSIGKLLVDRYQYVPFSLRDAYRYLESKKEKISDLENILENDHFHGYRPLIEHSKGMVAQAEHTILVTKSGAKIITG